MKIVKMHKGAVMQMRACRSQQCQTLSLSQYFAGRFNLSETHKCELKASIKCFHDATVTNEGKFFADAADAFPLEVFFMVFLLA